MAKINITLTDVDDHRGVHIQMDPDTFIEPMQPTLAEKLASGFYGWAKSLTQYDFESEAKEALTHFAHVENLEERVLLATKRTLGVALAQECRDAANMLEREGLPEGGRLLRLGTHRIKR